MYSIYTSKKGEMYLESLMLYKAPPPKKKYLVVEKKCKTINKTMFFMNVSLPIHVKSLLITERLETYFPVER